MAYNTQSNNMHRMRCQLVGKVNEFLYVGSANANLLVTCTMHECDPLKFCQLAVKDSCKYDRKWKLELKL